MEEEVTVWYDGTLSPASAATMPVSWMGPRLSTAVFDGIRAYWDPDADGLNVFRLDDHMQRFARARRFQRMDAPWSDEELTAAVLEVLRANDFGEDAYVAPNAFFGIDATAAGGGSMGRECHVAIVARRWPSNLASPQAIDCGVSSWVRIADNSMPARIKCIANYHNYRLATLEVQDRGCDHFFAAIMLNQQGKVSEAAMASLFVLRDGAMVTSPVSADILEGVTRATVMKLCGCLGVEVVERAIDRTELYEAEEVFQCGTGSEITPVGSVDGVPVGGGGVGEVTGRVIELYERVVRGREEWCRGWLTAV